MDVVYVLRNGGDYEEFKYSLRSLGKIKIDNVYIFGGKPNWLKNVIHIPMEDKGPKYENVKHKQIAIMNHPDISEDFIYMNDDFYFLEDQEIKYYKIGKLKDQIEYIKERDNISLAMGRQVPLYYDNLKYVYDIFGDVDSFETHTPIVFNKTKLRKLVDKYPDYKPTSIRTLYCNEYKIKGERLETKNYKGYINLKDCKCYEDYDLQIIEGQKLLSTENTCTGKQFNEFMSKLFPNMSMYEKIELTPTQLYNILLPLFKDKMKLKGTPGFVINRFGKRFIADNDGILEANNQEELQIFIAYGFKPLEEIEEPKQATIESKKEVTELEVLQKEYEAKFGKKIAPAYKNNIEWIKNKLLD